MDIFQTIIFLFLSEAFISTDCFFNISSLWLLWLLSHIHILSLFPFIPTFSLSLFLPHFSGYSLWHILPEQSHHACGFNHHVHCDTFQTHLPYPYHCVELQAQCPTTCWFFFWMFHSYLSFSFFKITFILSHLSISEENAIFLPSKLDGPWLLFFFPYPLFLVVTMFYRFCYLSVISKNTYIFSSYISQHHSIVQ